MSQERVDVLIVVALRPELDAVLHEGAADRAGWREAQDSTGATYYLSDETNARGQVMRIAAAWLGDWGQEAATSRSRRLVDELDPVCLAMCGVCSGRPESVKLGDVIVAERVFDVGVPFPANSMQEMDLAWRMNAATLADDVYWRNDIGSARPVTIDAQARWLLEALLEQEAGGQSVIERADRKTRCPRWADVVRRMLGRDIEFDTQGALLLTAEGRRRMRESKVLFPDGPYEEPPFRVHLGALANPSASVKDANIVDVVRGRVWKPLGTDFESAAIASVATHTNRRWLVVKGVTSLSGLDNDDSIFPFAARASAAFLLTFLRRYFDAGVRAKPPSDRPEGQRLEPVLVEQLTINGFKNISEIALDLSAGTKLGGRWTCLAGINGSGKTSILQAVALALLGDKLSEQLGSVRLAQMVRQGEGPKGLAEITATVRIGAEVQTLALPLSSDGVDSTRLAGHPSVKEMRALWDKRARQGIFAAYGASRNLSEYLDNRHVSLHAEVQRVMTLFDPLARVAKADLLLSEDPQIAPVVRTLRIVLGMVLEGLLVEVAPGEGSLRFAIDGAVLPASALPDGFRSTVAWLGDLCALWHEKAPADQIGDGDPTHMHGVVLIDEIDLHLHPSLQRVLVPRLRKAMPRMQWIVSTHSPLVLASFDRREIKMLDSAQPGGVRELDRDILGFTTDEIYDWLMDTKPRGAVLEEMLKQADEEGADAARREEIAVQVATAPDFSEDEAKKRVAWRQALLSRLGQGSTAVEEKKD